MKNSFIFLLMTAVLFPVNAIFSLPMRQNIDSGWRFKQARSENWFPATVPGVVHTDLLDNRLIEDPFFRLNERSVQWIDKEDWIYETELKVSEETAQKENICLYFKGLDTYADVYLNDKKLLEANNMFREWKIDVKPHIKVGKNHLKIYFYSSVKTDIPKWETLPFHYNASNDQSENGGLLDRKLSVFARKAGYHYGWDWGPRLVTSGIWRPVFLEAWDNAKIEDVFHRQTEVSEKQAIIKTQVEILSDKEIKNTLVTIREENRIFAQQKINLKKGNNNIMVDFSIKNPELWWTNGLGDAHLYHFQTTVSDGKSVFDSDERKIGIRSLKLINQNDKDGKSFYFELNGLPVFAKGANYIPSDVFLPRLTFNDYEKEVLDAANVNMNMLRVWGGGIYEDDVFYNLCDASGILVWQDFMFACSVYPADNEFLENVRQEAVDNIKRLRNHPSIALWCGNNEINEAWFGWGWRAQYTEENPSAADLIFRQYDALFNQLLPEVVSEYAPETFYHPSSPFSRYDGVSEANRGDSHYWGVWHGLHPISRYNTERSRFFSEYGFQSFPEWESIKIYAPQPEDWSISSEVMMAHQRGGSFANKRINEYLEENYKPAPDFQTFLYVGQVLQADAIKTAIEAHRRDMPYCMGSLFWQHNDCWPVASWSSRDYYRRWKAQHYFAREAFRDILISPVSDGENLNIYAVSDRLKNTRGTLNVRIITMNGNPVEKIEKKLRLNANSSNRLLSISMKNYEKEKVVVALQFTDDKNNIYTNNYFGAQAKEMKWEKPNIQFDIQPINDGFDVSLTSDKFARAVFLSIEGIDNFFENNYFDLLPDETVKVKVKTKLSLDEFRRQLKIRTLNEL
ncbi:MAG: glycoside hydrolase family 2 protein [Candidatus Symbiothrix sp.]|jgi:beta-mannosidase|nr:glycoside hydrolase family 2 protein [Candidatus Symbiothrix sp.]